MAAPTVGAVMADILPYLGVQRQFSSKDIASQQIVLQDYAGVNRMDAEKALKQFGITVQFAGTGETVTGQIPAAGKTIPGGSQMLLYLGEEVPEDSVQVPEFTGMNREAAAAAAKELGLYILYTGSNDQSAGVIVTSQDIPAGTKVSAGSTIQLEFTDTGIRD